MSCVPLSHPCNVIIAGPSQSGKSYFVEKLIFNFNVTFKHIHFYYSEWQPLYERLPHITFFQGLPKMTDYKGDVPTLLILDDLMGEAGGKIGDLFTKGTHHRNLSVIFITQNLFHQSRDSRDMSLNCHYLVCFKNPRDVGQIQFLARQMFPHNSKFLIDAYRDATSRPHGYLFLDFKQDTPEDYRVRTHILPGETCMVYVPKKK